LAGTNIRQRAIKTEIAKTGRAFRDAGRGVRTINKIGFGFPATRPAKRPGENAVQLAQFKLILAAAQSRQL